MWQGLPKQSKYCNLAFSELTFPLLLLNQCQLHRSERISRNSSVLANYQKHKGKDNLIIKGRELFCMKHLLFNSLQHNLIFFILCCWNVPNNEIKTCHCKAKFSHHFDILAHQNQRISCFNSSTFKQVGKRGNKRNRIRKKDFSARTCSVTFPVHGGITSIQRVILLLDGYWDGYLSF